MKTSPWSGSITIARNTGLGSAMVRAGARSKIRGRRSGALVRCCAATAVDTTTMPTIRQQNFDERIIVSENNHTAWLRCQVHRVERRQGGSDQCSILNSQFSSDGSSGAELLLG